MQFNRGDKTNTHPTLKSCCCFCSLVTTTIINAPRKQLNGIGNWRNNNNNGQLVWYSYGVEMNDVKIWGWEQNGSTMRAESSKKSSGCGGGIDSQSAVSSRNESQKKSGVCLAGWLVIYFHSFITQRLMRVVG